jgi:uncharacterized protein YndB with AHSA1/START domain
MDFRNSLATLVGDREIATTRYFDAPRELVFAMWKDPQHLGQWWGPKGFTTTTFKMDMRPGGVWRFVMHGPDGTDYENKITYVEVVEPERLVYKHGGDVDTEPVNFTVTATFEDVGGKTKLTMRMVFPSAKARDFVVKNYGAVQGLDQTIGRLEEKLAHRSEAPAEFVIIRTFDASRERVWKAWSERDALMKWFGPKDFTMTTATLDFRPGGMFHYSMRGPDGKDMWGKMVYREIIPQKRIVWLNSFSDPSGATTPPPFDDAWPIEMLSSATLAEHERKTTVTIRWSPLNPSAAEKKTFDTNHESMTMGWTGTFDQLAEHLAKS